MIFSAKGFCVYADAISEFVRTLMLDFEHAPSPKVPYVQERSRLKALVERFNCASTTLRCALGDPLNNMCKPLFGCVSANGGVRVMVVSYKTGTQVPWMLRVRSGPFLSPTPKHPSSYDRPKIAPLVTEFVELKWGSYA